jgi:hypothetical protein
MSKILTKKIQSQLSAYFSSETVLTKPELRCLKEMVLGVLKSKSVFINQIAASLREFLKLKDVCKRLSAQYLKEDYAKKVRTTHLKNVGTSVSKDNFILMDGTDISKKYAKYMEGLEFVKDGDTSKIGLGYNVLNINAINTHKEMTPLYSKAYSFQMGALSSNNEIKNGVREVKQHIGDKGCWVFDRGADTSILKDFFFDECSQVIIRLKRNTMIVYKKDKLKVSQLVKRVNFSVTQTVAKIKKNKPVLKKYQLGAIPVNYIIKGVAHSLWLVVSRDLKHGGLCYLLVKSELTTPIEVAKWAFNGYGLRWKIEEYHRHVKQEYKLEDIQLKTFEGLQSMLAVLTVAMYMIYKKIQSLHFGLLLDSGYNYLNKNSVSELTNFIYYKISKVVSILLMQTKNKSNVTRTTPLEVSQQLNFGFN